MLRASISAAGRRRLLWRVGTAKTATVLVIAWLVLVFPRRVGAWRGTLELVRVRSSVAGAGSRRVGAGRCIRGWLGE